jgi:hypothetical protein
MAKKTRQNTDWNSNTRQRGLALLQYGTLHFAAWTGAALLLWWIDTNLFGRQRVPWLPISLAAAGVVVMLAGAFLAITRVADSVIVTPWLDPARHPLLFQICLFVILLLAVWVYIWFF